jgi:hypothetical protein
MEEQYPGMSKFRGFAVGCFVDRDFPAPTIELQRQYAHHWVPDFTKLQNFDDFGDPSITMANS